MLNGPTPWLWNFKLCEGSFPALAASHPILRDNCSPCVLLAPTPCSMIRSDLMRTPRRKIVNWVVYHQQYSWPGPGSGDWKQRCFSVWGSAWGAWVDISAVQLQCNKCFSVGEILLPIILAFSLWQQNTRGNYKTICYRVIVSTATKIFADMSHYIALYWPLWTFNVIVTYRHLIFSVKQPSKYAKNDISEKR